MVVNSSTDLDHSNFVNGVVVWTIRAVALFFTYEIIVNKNNVVFPVIDTALVVVKKTDSFVLAAIQPIFLVDRSVEIVSILETEDNHYAITIIDISAPVTLRTPENGVIF